MKQHTTIRMRVVTNGEQYLGECIEFPVMTHGRSLEELIENMERAIALFLSEDGLAPGPGEEESVVAVRIALPDCPA